MYQLGSTSDETTGDEDDTTSGEDDGSVLYLFRNGADANTDITGGLTYDELVYNNSYKTYDMSGLKLGTTAKETPYLHTGNIMNFEEYDTLNITIDETYGIADDGVILGIMDATGKETTLSLNSGVNTIYTFIL